MTLPATPRISVVVPVRDRRELLDRLLGALAVQGRDDVEVVVVDDGSTDGSGDVAERWLGSELDGTVVRTGGVGAVEARTRGVVRARGEILAFTDSDCEPLPGWLDAAVEAIDRGADVVQGLTRPAGPVGPLDRSVWAEHEDGLYATCNVVYRREAFEAAGGFVADGADRFGFRTGRRARGLGFGEDSLLGWRVRRRGRSAFVAEAEVRHAVHPADPAGSLSRAWQAGGFVGLVGEVPELRETLLRHRVLLGDRAQLALLGGVVAAAWRRPASAIAALGWWVGHHARRVGWRRELPVVLVLEVVQETALVTASIRRGRLVI